MRLGDRRVSVVDWRRRRERRRRRGARQGCVFGHGVNGLGYYRDQVAANGAGTAAPVALTLDELIPLPSCTWALTTAAAGSQVRSGGRTRRARRARRLDGKRVKRPVRRRLAAHATRPRDDLKRWENNLKN